MISQFFGLLLLFTSPTISSVKEGIPDYTVFVKQNNKIQMLKRGVFTLEKGVFSFDFRFSEPMGVYINASLSPESYEAAKAGKNSKDIPGMAKNEVKYTENKDDKKLLISSNSTSYLYYNDEKDHSFVSAHQTKDNIRCERIIAEFEHSGTTKKTAVQNLEKKLYIVIIAKAKNKKTGIEEEVKRSFFILDFK